MFVTVTSRRDKFHSKPCKFKEKCPNWIYNSQKKRIECHCKYRHFKSNFDEWLREAKLVDLDQHVTLYYQHLAEESKKEMEKQWKLQEEKICQEIKEFELLERKRIEEKEEKEFYLYGENVRLYYLFADEMNEVYKSVKPQNDKDDKNDRYFLKELSGMIVDYCFDVKETVLSSSSKMIASESRNCSIFACSSCERGKLGWIFKTKCYFCDDELDENSGMYSNDDGNRGIVICIWCDLFFVHTINDWHPIDFEELIEQYCIIFDAKKLEIYGNAWLNHCKSTISNACFKNRNKVIEHMRYTKCGACGKKRAECAMCGEELDKYASVVSGRFVDCYCYSTFFVKNCDCEKFYEFDYCRCSNY